MVLVLVIHVVITHGFIITENLISRIEPREKREKGYERNFLADNGS